MAKKKNNNRPKRQTRKPKRVQSKRSAPAERIPRSLVSAICSVSDPFCQHARGAKWHDTSAVNSLAYTVRGAVTVTTDASGNASVLLVPTWPYGTSTGVVTGNNAAFTNFDNFDMTSTLNSTVSSVRLVSGGYNFVSTCSMSTSQGYVIAQDLAAVNGSTLASIDCDTARNNGYIRQPLRDTNPIAYVFRAGGPGSRDWYATTTATVAVTSTNSRDWSTSCISIRGGPASTQVGVIDYILHFELQFDDSSAYGTMTTPARGANSLVTDASSNMHSVMPAFHSGYSDKITKVLEGYAIKALMNAAPIAKATAIRGISAYFGPMGGMATKFILDGPTNNNMYSNHHIMDAD